MNCVVLLSTTEVALIDFNVLLKTGVKSAICMFALPCLASADKTLRYERWLTVYAPYQTHTCTLFSCGNLHLYEGMFKLCELHQWSSPSSIIINCPEWWWVSCKLLRLISAKNTSWAMWVRARPHLLTFAVGFFSGLTFSWEPDLARRRLILLFRFLSFNLGRGTCNTLVTTRLTWVCGENWQTSEAFAPKPTSTVCKWVSCKAVYCYYLRLRLRGKAYHQDKGNFEKGEVCYFCTSYE